MHSTQFLMLYNFPFGCSYSTVRKLQHRTIHCDNLHIIRRYDTLSVARSDMTLQLYLDLKNKKYMRSTQHLNLYNFPFGCSYSTVQKLQLSAHHYTLLHLFPSKVPNP